MNCTCAIAIECDLLTVSSSIKVQLPSASVITIVKMVDLAFSKTAIVHKQFFADAQSVILVHDANFQLKDVEFHWIVF